MPLEIDWIGGDYRVQAMGRIDDVPFVFLAHDGRWVIEAGHGLPACADWSREGERAGDLGDPFWMPEDAVRHMVEQAAAGFRAAAAAGLSLQPAPASRSDEEVTGLLGACSREGLKGFGGHCGSAALVINQALFGGAGTITGGFNRAFWERGESIGHVAVMREGVFWDADARPKAASDIERWGRLDAGDVDYRMRAASADIRWSRKAAAETVLLALTPAEVASGFDLSRFQEQWQIMREVLRTVLRPVMDGPEP